MHEQENAIPDVPVDAMDAVKAVALPREGAGKDAGAVEDDGVLTADPAQPANETPDANGYGEFDWPEGYIADPKAMGKFVPLARKLGLDRDGAQSLARLYAELDQERTNEQARFIAENNARWLKDIHSHPEFGGRNLERTGENVASMFRRYGTPLLTAQIRQMNIQNWPEMFFFLARVSQAVTEDCSPSGTAAPAPAKSTAQLLFPGLK